MRPIAKKLVSILAASACACVVAASASAPTRAQDAERGTRRVVVVVRDLRSDRGVLVAALYTSPDVWLRERHAAADCHATIRNGEARCVFDVPLSGPVAFCAMHDEDGDGAFDRDFLGLPQEGYAFSNDVREPFGPPSFQAASFRPAEARPFVVHARYGI
jgi:uncharacterized protein (DUF2141 family)